MSAFGGEADISQRLPTIAIYEYVLTWQHARRTCSDGYWRDFGWSRSSQGHLRGHRDTDGWRAGEIRTRQGVGGAHGRSLPTHRHVLSGELWLHPADIIGRRRSLRRAGRFGGAGGGGGDRALPAGGCTADGRRGWSRRKNHRSAGRRACPLLRGHSQLPRSAADHVRADRSLFSALQGSGKGQMGHYRQVARRERRRKAHTRGDRARRKGASEGGRQAKGHAGTHSTNWRPTESAVEKMTKIISRPSRPIAGHQKRSCTRLGAGAMAIAASPSHSERKKNVTKIPPRPI